MKSVMLLLPFILAAQPATASLRESAECMAKAEVLTITSKDYDKPVYNEVRKIYYAPFKILETDCHFLKKGQVYNTTGSNANTEDLQQGMIVKAGVAQNDVMGPNGVIYFLDWQPIEIVSPEPKAMPEDYLRTSERSPL